MYCPAMLGLRNDIQCLIEKYNQCNVRHTVNLLGEQYVHSCVWKYFNWSEHKNWEYGLISWHLDYYTRCNTTQILSLILLLWNYSGKNLTPCRKHTDIQPKLDSCLTLQGWTYTSKAYYDTVALAQYVSLLLFLACYCNEASCGGRLKIVTHPSLIGWPLLNGEDQQHKTLLQTASTALYIQIIQGNNSSAIVSKAANQMPDTIR